MQIRYVVLHSDMGDGWRDSAGAAEALAKLTTSRLRQAYPDADVLVDVARDPSGIAAEALVTAHDGVRDDLAQRHAAKIVEQAWSEFCDAPETAN